VITPSAPLSLEARLWPRPRIRAAVLDDINAILDLHCEAFADKFWGAFGSKGAARGAAALALAWRHQGATFLRGMFVAEWEGQIIGTTMLRTAEMENDFSATTRRAFQQILGTWGATRSIFALSLLSHQIGRQEGFITDVAVVKGFRRYGVATLLVEHAEAHARVQHKRYLGLYVSKLNEGAQHLYTRAGFRTVRVRRSWLTRLVFGHRSWLYMRKELYPQEP
jgi:ribosomal protein S18 acetylase RimI-like enzyme